MQVGEQLPDVRAEHCFEWMGGLFEHRDLGPRFSCGRSDFEPDPARADHDDPAGQPLLERECVIEGAQVGDRYAGVVGKRKLPRGSTGGQQQAVVGEIPVRQRHSTAIQVDGPDPFVEEGLDLMLVVPLCVVDEDRVGLGRAEQQPLGQRRSLIGEVRLGADQGDVLGVALLAQLTHRVRCGEPPTDDDGIHNWLIPRCERGVRRAGSGPGHRRAARSRAARRRSTRPGSPG